MKIRAAIFLSFLSAPALAGPLPNADADFSNHDPAKVELGQLLFFDPILSGNREVSCATCHHPRFGTSDGVSLGLGDGAKDLGPDRTILVANHPEQRIPRNAPALFNLGASEFVSMFHDGRLEKDDNKPGGIRTPLGQDMTSGFDSVLAAQAMFPVLSGDEMAGHFSENEISQAVRQGFLSIDGGAWDRLSARISAVPGYRNRFDAVIGADKNIAFADIANAIAAFIAFEWRADNSPFDRFLKHSETLPEPAEKGMTLFYGKAGCDTCHAGQFQTDHDFHAIAMPQTGPGKAAKFEDHARDIGRMRVTGDDADAYRFRTPSLRNIFETAPYGHTGAYASLEAVIRHHLDPVTALWDYDASQMVLPNLEGTNDLRIMSDMREIEAIADANELQPSHLSDAEIANLIAFLASLSDTESLAGRLGVPKDVPSGLPVDQ